MAKSFKRIIKINLYSIFFTFVFLILFPTCLAFFTPMYIIRFLVTLARKVFRPDLGKLVQTRSAVIAATDSPYSNPNWILCVWLVMDGRFNLEQFRINFYRDIILRKCENGELHSPEFQQYFTQWLGFTFWKWEKNFSVEEHLRYLYPEDKDRPVGEEELRKIIKRLTWEPFKEKKSPWEFVLIPNYVETGKEGEEKCVLFYRVHHGFCDGFSILNLLMKEINGGSMDNHARPIRPNRSIFDKIAQGLLFWISCPYLFMKMLVRTADTNEWHDTYQEIVKPMNTGFTPIIPLNYIKEIKNLHKVTFSAVIYASITGALRKTMMEVGKKVPKYMSTAVAVPMPGHPLKLRNHFIFSFLQLPLGIEDPVERLKKIDRNIRRLKKSPVPLFNFWLIPMIGATFSKVMKLFSPNTYSTILTSNFPGPSIPCKYVGGGGNNLVTDMNFSAGLGEGNVGIGFCMMSYADGIRIITSFAPYILPDDETVDVFNNKILEEMEELKWLGSHI